MTYTNHWTTRLNQLTEEFSPCAVEYFEELHQLYYPNYTPKAMRRPFNTIETAANMERAILDLSARFTGDSHEASHLVCVHICEIMEHHRLLGEGWIEIRFHANNAAVYFKDKGSDKSHEYDRQGDRYAYDIFQDMRDTGAMINDILHRAEHEVVIEEKHPDHGKRVQAHLNNEPINGTIAGQQGSFILIKADEEPGHQYSGLEVYVPADSIRYTVHVHMPTEAIRECIQDRVQLACSNHPEETADTTWDYLTNRLVDMTRYELKQFCALMRLGKPWEVNCGCVAE